MIVVSKTKSRQDDNNITAATLPLINAIKDYLKKALHDAGVQMNNQNSTKNSDGSVTYKLTFLYTPEGEDSEEIEVDFYVNGKPTNDSKDYVDLSFMYPDFKSDKSGKSVKKEIDKFKNVPNTTSDILKKCQQVIDNVFHVDTFEDMPEELTASTDVNQNKILKFTVQKVKSNVTASNYRIHIKNIFANYSPTSALQDISNIVSDSDFLDELSYDVPVSYGASVFDEDMDVVLLDDLDDESYIDDYKQLAYNSILDEAYIFYLDCKFVDYTACGKDMMRIQEYASNYMWRLEELIDTISKSIVAEKYELVHPIERIRTLQSFDMNTTQCNYWQEFVDSMKSHIETLIDVLTLYASNSSKEDESMIQGWIRTWKYDLDYVLCRSAL